MTPADALASRRLRVLVIGQSAVRRKLLIGLLREAGGFDIVGEVSGGSSAVARAASSPPSVIAIDSDLDGAGDVSELISELRARTDAPIVVLTAQDRTRSQVAREALHAGAAAVVARPEAPGDPAYLARRRQVLTALRAAAPPVRAAGVPAPRKAVPVRTPPLASARPSRDGPSGCASRTTARAGARASRDRIELIGVAASTGGPAALRRVLADLPAGHPPVLVVQHIGDGFADSLAEWLARSLPQSAVRIARDGEALAAGAILIAPAGRHLAVAADGRVVLLDRPPVANHRPSANVLFESIAENFGRRALAVVLTGMGRDGAAGLLLLARAGGHTIAQDAASSVVYGMPGAAAQIGAVTEVLPLDDIGPAISARIHGSRAARAADEAVATPS